MLSSGANFIIWDEMLSSGANFFIWDEMLSSGANVIIWDKMLSCGSNVVMVSYGANVIIWCYHVMLSSGMITPPFFFLKTSLTRGKDDRRKYMGPLGSHYHDYQSCQGWDRRIKTKKSFSIFAKRPNFAKFRWLRQIFRILFSFAKILQKCPFSRKSPKLFRFWQNKLSWK